MKKLILAPLLLSFIASTSCASESVGKYGDGTLVDGVSLERNGFGFQTMKRKRNRFWGHEEMIKFIKELSRESLVSGNGQLLIGDISKEKGGDLWPYHSSHQSGLDVDIWFWRPDDSVKDLDDSIREHMDMPLYADAYTNEFIPNKWDIRLDEVIKTAAEDNRVARVFVNPAVKKRLCRIFPGEDFLKKIRPWWRHHEHFHVRLKCPADSPKCINQAPSLLDECNSSNLEWWYSDDFKKEYERRYGKPSKELVSKGTDHC